MPHLPNQPKQSFFVNVVSLLVAETFLCSTILPAWASSSDFLRPRAAAQRSFNKSLQPAKDGGAQARDIKLEILKEAWAVSLQEARGMPLDLLAGFFMAKITLILTKPEYGFLTLGEEDRLLLSSGVVSLSREVLKVLRVSWTPEFQEIWQLVEEIYAELARGGNLRRPTTQLLSREAFGHLRALARWRLGDDERHRRIREIFAEAKDGGEEETDLGHKTEDQRPKEARDGGAQRFELPLRGAITAIATYP